MVWTQAATEATAAAGICLALILVRCGYRLLSNCKLHTNCHRTWHADDAWMAFSIVPLAARSITIALSFSLAEKSSSHHDYVVSRKLLIVSRLTYAFFLWCMKFCLVSFYSRFEDGSASIHRGIRVLWSWMVITFLACLVGTLAECVPMSIFWEATEPANQKSCYEGKPNLLTVAVLNLVTDLTLILFPIPILWRTTQLNIWVKVQLTLLFGVGIIVVAVTITRIPLILDHNFSQSTRTLWASVEIISACVVANAAFYYALIKDIQSAHNTLPRRRSSVTATSLHWIQGDDTRVSPSRIGVPVAERRTSMIGR